MIVVFVMLNNLFVFCVLSMVLVSCNVSRLIDATPLSTWAAKGRFIRRKVLEFKSKHLNVNNDAVV